MQHCIAKQMLPSTFKQVRLGEVVGPADDLLRGGRVAVVAPTACTVRLEDEIGAPARWVVVTGQGASGDGEGSRYRAARSIIAIKGGGPASPRDTGIAFPAGVGMEGPAVASVRHHDLEVLFNHELKRS